LTFDVRHGIAPKYLAQLCAAAADLNESAAAARRPAVTGGGGASKMAAAMSGVSEQEIRDFQLSLILLSPVRQWPDYLTVIFPVLEVLKAVVQAFNYRILYGRYVGNIHTYY